MDQPAAFMTPAPRMICGVPIHPMTMPQTVAWIMQRIAHGRPAIVATVNVDFLMQAWRDQELQRILLEADLVVADGHPVLWLARVLGPALPQRVTGSDLVPAMAVPLAQQQAGVFLLGGRPGVPEEAGRALQRLAPELRISGTASPPPASILDLDHAGLAAAIAAANPAVLLVAFGAPKQEKFITWHRPAWAVPVSIGVGGTLDFLAGTQVRAPRWLQRIGLEWLWRAGTNPRRLAGRYVRNIGYIVSALWFLARWRCARPGRKAPLSTDDHALLTAHRVRVDRLGDAPRPPADAVLDMGGTGWLDSGQLGQVMAWATRQRADGKPAIITGFDRRVVGWMRRCRLHDHVTIVDDAVAAVACFQRHRQLGLGIVCERFAGRLLIRLPAESTRLVLAELVKPDFLDDQIVTVVIDASATTYLDSGGMGALAGLAQRCRTRGMVPMLVGLRGAPREALQRIGLHAAFHGLGATQNVVAASVVKAPK